jgi:hypothetical protein
MFLSIPETVDVKYNTVEPRFYIPVIYKFLGPLSFLKLILYCKPFPAITPFLLSPFKSLKEGLYCICNVVAVHVSGVSLSLNYSHQQAYCSSPI